MRGTLLPRHIQQYAVAGCRVPAKARFRSGSVAMSPGANANGRAGYSRVDSQMASREPVFTAALNSG